MEETKEMKLAVEVKLKVKDVLKYNLYVAYKSWFSKLILVLGLGMCSYVVYKGLITERTWDIFISENIILIMLSVFILVATPFKVWSITAQQMQMPVFSGTTEYVFTKESIYMHIGELEDTVPWTTYSRIIETSGDFRLFVDAVQAQIIPKHNMTKEQINAFKTIVKEANPKEIYKLK